ncbi:MAG: 1,4-dihydroxy-2-naphthoate polyprenyltransferase [Actinomycetota bacterium]|nr:1,4-dihydroxy-2-naphthoate polyprenyltransferase [Actinomycetota bacterium]
MTNRWVLGARPRTLPAAVVPVAVGTAVAFSQGDVVWWRAVTALVVALAIQVATNYANDYSDGVRGTDEGRVGPVRLVASGLAPATAVKRAALVAFAVAGAAGLALAAAVGPELVAVGAACLAAGWFYTGGSRPYGYVGLGEVSVFAFFGVVATVGSAYVHLERVTALAVVASIPVGLLATALLVVNNLRDIPTDAASGKRTLAVRLGDHTTRVLYASCLAGAFAALPPLAFARPPVLVAFATLALARGPVTTVLGGAVGRDLVAVLVATGRLQLAFGLLLAAGIAA